jgi:hypothetical protein
MSGPLTPPPSGHGLSRREQQIMDRFDAGMTPEDIAEELGLGLGYVRQCTPIYNGSWSGNLAFEAMVRAGTIALASAVARTGKVFL